ncbi:unnamed protein product [Sphagnum balticum]
MEKFYDEVAGGPLCMADMERGGASEADMFGFSSTTSAPPQVRSWFDVKVVYVGVRSCPLEDAPESLTMRFPPRNIGTALEVNGGRISPSEETNLILRRDRIDTESAEATYVNTSNLRTTGTLLYNVLNKDEAILIGSLEHEEKSSSCSSATKHQVYNNAAHGHHNCCVSKSIINPCWHMENSCVVGQGGCAFSRVRQREHTRMPTATPAAMEVCMVGWDSGTPVILTQTVQLTARRRPNWQASLDVIPEAEVLGKPPVMTVDEPGLITDSNMFPYYFGDKAAAAGGGVHCCDHLEGIGHWEGDDGEMSWFNAGVRVGVGIGLGMCLGVGIGIGLFVRTCQTTTKTFRRGFL